MSKNKKNKCLKEEAVSATQNTVLEEDDVNVKECIQELRALVEEEKNLKVRMDDNFMLRYLRGCGFQPKDSFGKMVKFYKLKAKHENLFCTTCPSDYKDILSQNFITMLEDRDQKGRHVILINLGNVDTSMVTSEKCTRAVDLFVELALEEEETQKNGMVIICDMGGFPLRLLRWCSPKKCIIAAMKEEMRPRKNFEMHIVNTSLLIDGLVAIVFPFLGEKFKQQMHFPGRDWELLHTLLDPRILPLEYGGTKATINYRKMEKLVYENEEKLKELFSLGYVTS